MRDSQSEYDVTVKCIVQCSQLFGEGVSFVESMVSPLVVVSFALGFLLFFFFV